MASATCRGIRLQREQGQRGTMWAHRVHRAAFHEQVGILVQCRAAGCIDQQGIDTALRPLFQAQVLHEARSVAIEDKGCFERREPDGERFTRWRRLEQARPFILAFRWRCALQQTNNELGQCAIEIGARCGEAHDVRLANLAGRDPVQAAIATPDRYPLLFE